MKDSLTYPKICNDSNGCYIVFRLNGIRHRIKSGETIGEPALNLNDFPENMRQGKAAILADKVYQYIIKNNFVFSTKRKSNVKQIELPLLALFDILMKERLEMVKSPRYRKDLERYCSILRLELISKKEITLKFLESIYSTYKNNSTYNIRRAHVNTLVNHLYDNKFPIERSFLKKKRPDEKMHAPIKDIMTMFKLLKNHNRNLHVCCLLVYGCLLRPHREIRLLTWKDFNAELTHIALGGNKVKNRKNRVVPIPEYVRKELLLMDNQDKDNYNIFSNSTKPYNNDYFKTKWTRFKKKEEIDKDITIYSFRHTGSIQLYERDKDIIKLKKTLNHSRVQVTVGYLRGLEINTLTADDMPSLS